MIQPLGGVPMKRTLLSLSITLSLFVTAGAVADDWPQWQGPDRNAMSKESGLLQGWAPEGPPLAWRADGLGGGYSTPSIAAGRIFGMSHRAGQEVVWAIAEKDGSPIWTARLGSAFDQGRPQAKEGPGSTPTVDGDLLFVLGLDGEVSCLRVADGEIVWQRNLQEDFDAPLPVWSFRESLLVVGEKVVVTPGAADATLVALDRGTGSTVWTSLVPGSPGPAYSSPIAIDFDGQQQIVQFTADNVVGVAADDGTFLWSYAAPANENGINISSPLHDRGRIFAASAYDTGGGLARLHRRDDGSVAAEEIYFTRRMQNQHGGMVVLDGVLYGANGGRIKALREGGGSMLKAGARTLRKGR
jgi:outer membrane protein assembly factor BamB